MARIIKEEEYAAKRNEILDAAQRLVYTKGFDQMSIQDILNELSISKGAFYHYFESKSTLLEALIERSLEAVVAFLSPIVQNSELPALVKLQHYLDSAAQWKSTQKDYLLGLLSIWYADENATFRQKMLTSSIQRISPMLAEIIRQGILEGALSTAYPDQVAETVLYLMQGVGDKFVEPLLKGAPTPADFQRIESAFAAYTDAMERILGAPPGSIQLIKPETLQFWFGAPKEHPPH